MPVCIVLIRCAIDQLYVTEEVAMVSFHLGDFVGSDHYPLIAKVRIDPDAARGLNAAPPALTDSEAADLQDRLQLYRTELDRRLAEETAGV